MRFRSLLFFLVITIAACATTLETVFVPGDSSRWRVGYSSDRRGRTLVEYVPDNEYIENWTKLFTIQFLEGERASPIAVMQAARSRMRERCPNVSWNIINQDALSVLYEWKISGCSGNPDQHEIARLLKGNDGVHRVAYVEKVPNITRLEREKWLKALSGAYVEKGGQRVVISP